MASSSQTRIFSGRAIMYVVMMVYALGIAVVTVRMGYIFGLIAAIVPFVLVFGLAIITNPYLSMLTVFVVNYFIMGITRYIPAMPRGVMMDMLIGITLIGLLIQSCYRRLDWRLAANPMTFAVFIWVVYCIWELVNPAVGSAEAWMTSIRGVALYFFLMAIITPVVFNKFKDVQKILLIWSVLTLLAIVKAYVQKNQGFDAAELRWLWEQEGARTHLISSGIRYFSFFSDAANFGSGMAFSMVVFSACAMMVKSKFLKIYFIFVALAAGYGMMISGTRGAIIVPFAGYALYIALSKNIRVIVVFSILVAGTYLFLNHTMIGHGNTYIRRMRGAFNPQDASLVVRLENQALMRSYLKDHPFGVGIGLGGGKAKVFAPDAYMSQIPTDSWFVMIWAETGIVGLSIYVGILIFLIIKCSIVVMFQIKDRHLRGVLGGLLAGCFGIMVCSYGNEIMGQFPTSLITYMSLIFILLGPRFDKQIAEEKEMMKLQEVAENGKVKKKEDFKGIRRIKLFGYGVWY